MNNITVLLINHNYAQYLNDAIQSCFSQTVKPYCIMIVDDGSTDDSWTAIMDLYLNEQEPIYENNLRIWRTKKDGILVLAVSLAKAGGPSLARNIGIDITKDFTNYYQVLDSDDVMYDNKLEVLSKKITSDPNLGVVYGNYDILNVQTGNIIREWKEPFSQRRLLQECIVHSGSMINRDKLVSVMEPTGYYDVNLRCAEDYDLWLRLSEVSQIAHVPQSLTLVRTHNQNSTFSVNKEVWEQCWGRVGQKLQSRQR